MHRISRLGLWLCYCYPSFQFPLRKTGKWEITKPTYHLTIQSLKTLEKLQVCSPDVTRMDLEDSWESWQQWQSPKTPEKLLKPPVLKQLLSGLEIPPWAQIPLVKEYDVRKAAQEQEEECLIPGQAEGHPGSWPTWVFILSAINTGSHTGHPASSTALGLCPHMWGPTPLSPRTRKRERAGVASSLPPPLGYSRQTSRQKSISVG